MEVIARTSDIIVSDGMCLDGVATVTGSTPKYASGWRMSEDQVGRGFPDADSR